MKHSNGLNFEALDRGTRTHGSRFHEGGYSFFRNRAGYINIVSDQLPEDKVRLPWEFYFAVHPEDLIEAFELVSKRLTNPEKGAYYFTIADPSIPSDDGYRRNQITIYTFTTQAGELLQPPASLFRSLRAIEKALIRAGIRPSPEASFFDKISGSQFVEMNYYPTDGTPINDQSRKTMLRASVNPYLQFAPSPTNVSDGPIIPPMDILQNKY